MFAIRDPNTLHVRRNCVSLKKNQTKTQCTCSDICLETCINWGPLDTRKTKLITINTKSV